MDGVLFDSPNLMEQFESFLNQNPTGEVFILVPGTEEKPRDVLSELVDAGQLVDLSGYQTVSLEQAAKIKGVTVIAIRYRIKHKLLNTVIVRDVRTKRPQLHVVVDRKFQRYHKGLHGKTQE